MLHFNTIGHPQKFNLFDTLCAPGTGDLLSINQSNDTTFWYENFNDSIPIYAGALFQSPSIDSTTTWYAETMRGDLFYTSALETTTSSNIYWNGAMMDIIPSEDLILDSIGLKVNTTGQQSVDIYFKTGSYIGFENNANAWTLLTTSTSFVDDSLGFTYYTLPSFTLTSGDTLGLYMQMSNPQSKLSYQSVSNPITRSNSELTIITGSGVSYNFSGSYFPRDLNCDIHYHFGSRPHGACSTGKYPATIFISDFEINIGNDTIIDIGDSISIEVPLGLVNWYWNNSSTDSTLILTGIDLGPGIHYIVLSGYDSLDCFKTDERIIGVADLVSVNESRILYGNLYPNPTKDWIYADREYHQIAIYSISGELVSQSSNLPFNISSLPSGIYYITVLNKNYETERFKIIKN